MNNRRLEKAQKLLELAYKSGHLRDRDNFVYPDMNAEALIYSAVKLIKLALEIQNKETT